MFLVTWSDTLERCSYFLIKNISPLKLHRERLKLKTSFPAPDVTLYSKIKSPTLFGILNDYWLLLFCSLLWQFNCSILKNYFYFFMLSSEHHFWNNEFCYHEKYILIPSNRYPVNRKRSIKLEKLIHAYSTKMHMYNVIYSTYIGKSQNKS